MAKETAPGSAPGGGEAKVLGAGPQFGLAVPVRRSLQLIHEAIDSNQNSESEIHCQQRNKH